jgi:hypothetical protein
LSCPPRHLTALSMLLLGEPGVSIVYMVHSG